MCTYVMLDPIFEELIKSNMSCSVDSFNYVRYRIDSGNITVIMVIVC